MDNNINTIQPNTNNNQQPNQGDLNTTSSQIPNTTISAQPAQPKPVSQILVNPISVQNSAQKIKLPPLLWRQTQDLLMSLEAELGGPVLCYFTRESIVGDDVKYFYSHLSSIGKVDKLYFILYSAGGDGKSAFRIASFLKNYCKELIVVIPEMAASAATMLSLAGDSIMMTPLAYLTAVDTSITHPLNPKDVRNNPVKVELEELRRAIDTFSSSNNSNQDKIEIYKTIFNYIHPVALGSMERMSTLSETLCRDLLSLRNQQLPKDKIGTLINRLNRDYPSHGYPITRQIAKNLELPILETSERVDNLLWKYMSVIRIFTEQVRTDFNDSYFHTETYLTSIESVGRRVAVRRAMERRLDPIIKGWTTLREEFKWESIFEVEENGEKKLKITNLDF